MNSTEAEDAGNYSLVQGSSTPISIDSISYDSLTRTAALSVNGGTALPEAVYTLTVKNTIHDNLGDTLPADFVRIFHVDASGITIITNGISLPDSTILTNGVTLNKSISEIRVTFNEDAANPAGNTANEDVTNPANYLLVRPGPNGAFDTSTCLAGVGGDDITVPTGPVTYENGGGSGPFVARVVVNNGSALPDGSYRLLVCGTTSITDLTGNHLNNGADNLLTFTLLTSRSVAKNPTTGFEPGVTTTLPEQPAVNSYKELGDLWLDIPSLGVKAAITGVPLNSGGWDLTWLQSQIGWLEGTAYPTWQGNTVLTAHAYTSDGLPGPFALLKDLKYGDTFSIHSNGEEYIYTVKTNDLVKAGDSRLLTRHETDDWVTLITCQQYDEKSGSYLYRVVVRAVLTSVQEE
jgi:LPXTG-site transpeptidase (sortase) family protein